MIDHITFQIRVKDELRIVNGRRTVNTLRKATTLIVAGIGGKLLIDFIKVGWVEVKCVPGLFLHGTNISGDCSPSKVVKDIIDRLEWLGIRGWVRNSVRVIKLDITGWLPLSMVKEPPEPSAKVYGAGCWVDTNSSVCCYNKSKQLNQGLNGLLKGWRRFEVSWSGEIVKGRRDGLSEEKQLRVWMREALVGSSMERLSKSVKFNPSFAVEANSLVKVTASDDFGKIWLVPGLRSREFARQRASAKREGRFYNLTSLCCANNEVAVKSKDCSGFIKGESYDKR